MLFLEVDGYDFHFNRFLCYTKTLCILNKLFKHVSSTHQKYDDVMMFNGDKRISIILNGQTITVL